jgi:hypothetical protein
MTLPPENDMTNLKVIETKNIVYCSNFDLNINEWFNEYENIEIFKLNMRKNLGKFKEICLNILHRSNLPFAF